MIQMRGLMIAAVLLAALGGLVYWSNRSAASSANKPAADTTPKLVSIPEDQIARIDIKRAAGEATSLERKDGKWTITEPKPLRADQDSVNSLVSTLSSLSTDRLIDEKGANLKDYGLVSPAFTLTVTKKDGKSQQVLIGDEAPVGSAFYTKTASDPRVFTIANYNKSSLDKTAGDLRDKRLLTFDSDKLTRVELKAKGEPVEFGKNNQNEWQILKPRPMRADGGQVEDLVRKLRDARMDTSATEDDAKKADKAFASGTQVAIATVSDNSGTQELTVRRDKDKNYWAKSSATEGVHKVTSDIGQGLDKGLDDFRNKKLFDFGWNDPSKVEVRDGASTRVFQKSGDKWTEGGKQLESATLQTAVDKLRDLAATKFPDQGFTTATMDLAVTSGDGKKTEKVQLSNTGKDWLAKRENDPAIYQLDPTQVDELRKAVAGVKQAAQTAAPKKK